ncbi:MAG: hypothetical protein PHV98_06410 [Candidatus Omnitrophica bacterium]|nr:hypothetical protein [Candidatus Omnitrophota bacterium]
MGIGYGSYVGLAVDVVGNSSKTNVTVSDLLKVLPKISPKSSGLIPSGLGGINFSLPIDIVYDLPGIVIPPTTGLGGVGFPVPGGNALPGPKVKSVDEGLNQGVEYNKPGEVGKGKGEKEKEKEKEATKGVGIKQKIKDIIDKIRDFLGKDAKVRKNKNGDVVLISNDGKRRVRFDVKNPSPHKDPHVHIEINEGDGWRKSGPIYPR